MQVEIDNGRIMTHEVEKVPRRCKALLIILESLDQAEDVGKMTPIEAFEALQKHLNLDEAKAKAWMDMIRDARR